MQEVNSGEFTLTVWIGGYILIFMVTKEPDFAPDLEWMLQSDQVEETALINLLLVDYYSAVYRLALIYLEDKV